MLKSRNLLYFPCTETMLMYALNDKPELSRILGAAVPHTWPVSPEALPYFLSMVKIKAENAKWLNYIVVFPGTSTVVGDIGFLGPPDADGCVEIGYSVIPEYRGRGFATEMVQRMTDWAFSQQHVVSIRAHTMPGNTASIRILRRCGYVHISTIDTEKGPKYLWKQINPSATKPNTGI